MIRPLLYAPFQQAIFMNSVSNRPDGVHMPETADSLNLTSAPMLQAPLAQRYEQARALPITDAQRYQNAKREALEFFEACHFNQTEILAALKQCGVFVLTGDEHSLVNPALKESFCFAMTLIPDAKSPDPDPPQSAALTEAVGSDGEQFISGIEETLRQKHQVGLILATDPESQARYRETVFHEVFHIFQYANGLRSSVVDDKQNISFETSVRTLKRWYGTPLSPVIRAFEWLPLHLGRLFGGQVPTTVLSQNIQRNAMHEIETYQFLLENANRFKLTADTLKHVRKSLKAYQGVHCYAPELAKRAQKTRGL